jgi:hypothetical protein
MHYDIVHENETRAADAHFASHVRPGKFECLPQEIGKCFAGFDAA